MTTRPDSTAQRRTGPFAVDELRQRSPRTGDRTSGRGGGPGHDALRVSGTIRLPSTRETRNHSERYQEKKVGLKERRNILKRVLAKLRIVLILLLLLNMVLVAMDS